MVVVRALDGAVVSAGAHNLLCAVGLIPEVVVRRALFGYKGGASGGLVALVVFVVRCGECLAGVKNKGKTHYL